MTYKTILYNFIFIGIKICTKYHSLTFCLTTSGTQKDFLSVRERAGRIFKVYILFFQSLKKKKKQCLKKQVVLFIFYFITEKLSCWDLEIRINLLVYTVQRIIQ